MGENAAGPSMKIGEMARRFGLNVRTLRYYEELGLLPAAFPTDREIAVGQQQLGAVGRHGALSAQGTGVVHELGLVLDDQLRHCALTSKKSGTGLSDAGRAGSAASALAAEVDPVRLPGAEGVRRSVIPASVSGTSV